MPAPSEDSIDRFYAEVGARVRAARTQVEMTQASLSSTTGLTRSSIANLEAGRQRVQLHVLAVIAASLGRALSDLVPALESGPSFGDDVHGDLERYSSTALGFVREGLSALSDGTTPTGRAVR